MPIDRNRRGFQLTYVVRISRIAGLRQTVANSAALLDQIRRRSRKFAPSCWNPARWDGELEKTRSDGARVIVASRWSLRRAADGQPEAILETNNDITEHKRRELEIRTLNVELGKRSTELEATNKELESFAYSVSHDPRAPLRHMSGFTEPLQKSSGANLNEKSRRYLGIILDSARRMGNLIDDLLSFSRISRTEAHRALVSLEQLVQEALSEVRQEIEGCKVIWKLKLGVLPAWPCDRSMLRLVLVNLVSNAVKFTRTRPQTEIEIGCPV